MKARIFADENRKWWTLAAVSFGLFMIMLDNTVVNVALPSIERSLHISIAQLEWIVTAYALVFAALMITGGKLADLYGRRRIFVVGLAIFTLSSLACGFAPSSGFLIGAPLTARRLSLTASLATSGGSTGSLLDHSEAAMRSFDDKGGVSRRTIYNWMAGGKVQYVRTAGGSVRIFADTLWREPQALEAVWTEAPLSKGA